MMNYGAKARVAACAGLIFAVAACGPADEGRDVSEADVSYQDQLIERLIDAQPGDVIEIPEGVYSFDRSLSLMVDGVTIRGAGMDKTILSFKNQIAGAEGLLVTASDFTIEDLAIEDTIGDALKVNEGENIIIRRVRTEWTNGPDTENGAYGIYPVQTVNTLVEDCVAIAAADAGIYVGQSRNVVIRRNRAEFNVAGIEVENTIGADVYENVTTDNTGGILVFNMPHLEQPGHSTRVYNNRIENNNTGNFGAEGTAVASIPAGSGVVINSNDNVQVFDNQIGGNKTANVIVTSSFSSGFADDFDEADIFDPYPEGTYIYDNTFDGGGGAPDNLELQALRIATFGPLGRLPDVLWDGYVNPNRTEADGPVLCVDNGEVEVLNIDGQNGNANPRVERHDCTFEKLAPIVLTGPLAEG